MGEWKLRILHISDLHERGPREAESFRRRRVLGNAWSRNLDEVLQDGPIDLVCLTGDVADWGKPEEYGPATDFIELLLRRLSLPLERLFLVPGNHDIDRKKGESAWAELRGSKDKKGKLFRVPSLDLSRWMAGGEPPLGLEGVQREELLSRQEAYRDWVATRLGRRELLPSRATPHPFLGYRQTLRLADRPFPIHVVGLDSAWLAGDDNDSGKLLLTTDQVGRLTTDHGEPLAGFRLALVHHPLTDLADRGDCQRLLADNVDLLLRGHLHEEELETWNDPDRSARQLAAGCLYEGHHADQWPNACHIVEARLDEKGHPLRYDLRFRSWSKRGHWHDDNSLYAGTENGRLRWDVRLASRPGAGRSSGESLSGNSRRLRVTVHRAFFLSNSQECFFINATNLSENRDVEVTHVWIDTPLQLPVLQPDRPLPKRLRPDESWETWIRVDQVPAHLHDSLHTLVRARLSNGDIIPSERNENVPQMGYVPGGPIEHP